jgi:hypothetical protein
MRLGREQSAGYVEDTEADPIASAELAFDAKELTKLTPEPRLTTHPQPAAIVG